MGSTSEPYQNGTNVQNVVVYVANEDVQSIQQQRYLPDTVSSTHIFISNNNDRLVYSNCTQYRPSSVTFINDNISVKGIIKPQLLHNVNFNNVYNISPQNGSQNSNVFINSKMYGSAQHIKQDIQSDDGKLQQFANQENITEDFCAKNPSSFQQIETSNNDQSFTNKANDIANPSELTVVAGLIPRSDSVRSVDSVNSGCSSLSSLDGTNECVTDSVGNNNKEIRSLLLSENNYVRVNPPNVLNTAVKKIPPIKRVPFVPKSRTTHSVSGNRLNKNNICNSAESDKKISPVRENSPVTSISVPLGWKRLLSNGFVIYVRYVSLLLFVILYVSC